MMLSRSFKYLLLLSLSISSLIFSGCSEKEPQKNIRIGMNPWPGYEPFTLAKDLGYLDMRTNISRLNSATDVIKSFKSDLIDIACVTLDEAIILQENTQEEIKVITIMDFSTGGDVIVATKDISSMIELKGKRIGVESSALGAYMLSRAVDLTPDLELSDLIVSNIGYEHHLSEFKSKAIDAVVTFEPVKTRILQDDNTHIIFSSKQIPGEIIDVIIVKAKTIKTKKQELKRTIDAWYRAVEYINTNRDESLKMMAAYEDISLIEFIAAYDGLTVLSLEENILSFDSKLEDTITKINNTLLQKQLIQKGIDPTTLYTDEFLKR